MCYTGNMENIISHSDINQQEGFAVIRRMNYRMAGNKHSVFLTFAGDMDLFHDGTDGKLFMFRGMDSNDKRTDPRKSDQSLVKKSGGKSANKVFQDLVEQHKKGEKAERVRLYEKVATNKWKDKGEFELVDVKYGSFPNGNRKIFVFSLNPV